LGSWTIYKSKKLGNTHLGVATYGRDPSCTIKQVSQQWGALVERTPSRTHTLHALRLDALGCVSRNSWKNSNGLDIIMWTQTNQSHLG